MYRTLTRLSAVMMIGLGVAILVVTLWHGAGIGLLIGALFVAAGGARLYLLRRTGRG
jgi:hypothetical protein